MAEMLADDFYGDDRRRVVNAGVRHGRDAEIANLRAIADVGSADVTSTVIATRGERLVLIRVRYSRQRPGPDAFHADMLDVVEIDADERIAAHRRVRPRRHRRRLRGARRPVPRRRSGRTRAHMVGHRTGLRRAQSGTSSADDTGLGERRPPARGHRIRAWRHDRISSVPLWDLAPDFSTYIEAVHRLNDRRSGLHPSRSMEPRKRASTPSGGSSKS